MTDTRLPERFKRMISLVGPEAFARLQQATVTVVGLGAVGSYATEALARAGVGHLRLVDFDVVQLSNFNRQLYALEPNLGRPKVEIAGERVRQINPDCCVETLAIFAHQDTLDQILSEPLDLVVDAIDSVNPKTELLTTVQERGIPVISSMGAALRSDPTQIRIGRLAGTQHCPLARILRKRLRRRQVSLDLTCVYSTEHLVHLPLTAVAPGDPADHLTNRGRVRRTLGSLPTITGLFGLTVAHAALKQLLSDHR